MVKRRSFLQGAVALTLLSSQLKPFQAFAASSVVSNNAADGVSRYVDPFIGSGGHGHTFPGATLPFGMVQLSPDTYNSGWDACSGYHQHDGSIMGFSHTHLSGTGIGDLLDILVMPAMGEVQLQPGLTSRPEHDYRSVFDAEGVGSGVATSTSYEPVGPGYRSRYENEKAHPGYYSVMLKDHAILAELTATPRTGLHRYTFTKPGAGHLLVDLAHGFQDNQQKPTRVSEAQLRLIGNDTLVGGRRVHQWANGRHIYFALKVSHPFERGELYQQDKLAPTTNGDTLKGEKLKAVLHFENAHAKPLLVKVGISAVDIEGALANLNAESPNWDFDGTHQKAAAIWEHELGKIRIQNPSESMKRIFYTALYHTMIAPTLFSDADGRYRGMDLEVHHLPPGSHNYSTYSLWDTYRALHPLLTLYQPERVPDLVNALVRMTVESPKGANVWTLQGIETDCMVGYHSASVIAEAHAKGFKGIDYANAWPVLRKRAMEDNYRGLVDYRKLGFIPSDKEDEAVSKTLEYNYDDWAVAHLADVVGEHKDAEHLRQRSRNYKNLFDKNWNMVRPRAENGSWLEPFDPKEMGHSKKWRDFTEANAWQATFLNQHDLYGYMQLFGGEKAFEKKLDELFDVNVKLSDDTTPDIAGLVGQYAHGNEPSHHVAYLYAYTGSPHKTQKQVRNLLDEMYRDDPDGLPGNEDCGQMSAWYVMSALGLYAVDPVSADYVFGSPLVDHAEMDVGNGRKLVIRAENNGADKPYVQSIQWNGKPYEKSWITHADLVSGGELVFKMGATPNLAFGRDRKHRPPSFGTAATVDFKLT